LISIRNGCINGKKTAPEDLLPLTPAVIHILLALADEERHGLGIMLEVVLHLGPGTLYRCLKRMLARDW